MFRPVRIVVNRGVVAAGKQSVLHDLENMQTGGNRGMTIIATAAAAAAADAVDVGFMECVATVFDNIENESSSTGQYNAVTSTHAEINALVDYIAAETDFTTIERINISSPPCKSCAFVLELLGLLPVVHTSGSIYKHYTGSWEWPEQLRDHLTFDPIRWNTVRGYFGGANLSDAQIVEEIVKVVKFRSVL